jgi:sulfite reductase (NADPH) flavoprotein alpha-component
MSVPLPGVRVPRAALGNALALVALVALAAALWTLQPSGADAVEAGRRWVAAAVLAGLWLGFTARQLRAATPRPSPIASAAGAADAVLVAYASQTGHAQALAERTAQTLATAGVAVELHPLEHVGVAQLQRCSRAFFVCSTTGEGDAPDHALAFVRDVLPQAPRLDALRYAVLALGDSQYTRFCGFGRRLDQWLRQHGAQSLFDLVEVDNADAGALRHWQHHLALATDIEDAPDWSAPRYQRWRLLERRHLNPGSAGGAAFLLSLAPAQDALPQWEAGDIAEVGADNPHGAVAGFLQAAGLRGDAQVQCQGSDVELGVLLGRCQLPDPRAHAGRTAQDVADALKPIAHREYSIASLPRDGMLQLLVRRMAHADGRPGLASGWLCEHAPPGSEIAVRIRSNRNFHPPQPSRPMILIGNGTGMAGLRAHLKAREAAGARRNWLLFGERSRAADFFCGDEIQRWLASGFIERLDLAFSRDSAERCYVQHRLRAAPDALREWIDAGAAVHVCGSLAGMAPGVDLVLRDLLGERAVEDLLAQGRYRRDVY